MRGAVLWETGRPLTLEEFRMPRPKAGELIIKTKACKVCHSDLHVLKVELPFLSPCVLGHEVTGEVVDHGMHTPAEIINRFPVGSHVVGTFIMPCGNCFYCVKGQEDLCESFFAYNRAKGTLYDGETRLFLRSNGKPVYMHSMGGLAEKGLSSLVLEKSETLRSDGVAIGVHANGWRALEQLGLATELRETADIITEYHNVWQKQNKNTFRPTRKELRCLKRKDLVEALAKNLPAGTIHFGCHIATIFEDSNRHCTVLSTMDGSTIKARVLIGCDGANSIVARYLGLGAPSHLPRLILLGLTSYLHGHPFGTRFLRFAGDGFSAGRVPINENLVHFFVSRPCPSTGFTNESAAREYVLEKLQECPAEIAEMVRRRDPETKTLTKVWYRPPWQVLLGRFQRGTVTVAGDAMHVMGPFFGQGGSAALEDAVVLARSLSRAVPDGVVDRSASNRELEEKVRVALGKYVRERRPRLFRLSLESFVYGTLMTAKSLVKKLVCVAILALLGNESRRHADYDCGRL